MASFGKIRNGAVAKFKVLCIFVKAWCWFFATFSSRRTLYVIMKEEAQKEKQLIKFLTEYRKEDGMYAGHIFAETWKEAEELAKQKGETVYGYIPPDCLDCEQELELRETI